MQLDKDLKIFRREACLRSREHQGVFVCVIYESDTVKILRTEMEAGTVFDQANIGASSAVHYVIEGSVVFRASEQCSELMPGDSIVFEDGKPYTVANCAPSRSVILSILFQSGAGKR